MRPLFFSAVSTAAVVIAGAGLVVLALGLWRLWRAARTRGWAPVPGTIEAAEVEELPGPEGAAGPLYRARVRYRYTPPGGPPRTGTRVSLEEVALSAPGPARAVVARYPPGAAATVHVDPADPARAVLEPGVSGASALLPAVGAGLLGLAAGMGAIVRLWSGR